MLEQLVLNKDTADAKEIDSLHSEWQSIATHAKSEMTQRYQRVCDRFSATPVVSPEPINDVTIDTEAEVEVVAEPAPDVQVTPKANESLIRLFTDIRLYSIENSKRPRAPSITKMKHQLEKNWKRSNPELSNDLVCYNFASALLEDLEATLEKQQKVFENKLAQANELLARLEAELEQGELHKALESRAKLQQSAKGHGKNREWQKLNNSLNSMQPRLRELRDWQHWSNNKVRKRLTAEMEVLPAADLHPDALLDRIKSLQLEWKSLEQSEQIPGDKKFSAAPWMWRKFSAAGHAAFDTAKPFLDKRSEIQSRHAQSLATFCAELQQLAQAEPVDWVALGKGLTRGRKKLQDLNEVPANQRQKLARKLKAALD